MSNDLGQVEVTMFDIVKGIEQSFGGDEFDSWFDLEKRKGQKSVSGRLRLRIRIELKETLITERVNERYFKYNAPVGGRALNKMPRYSNHINVYIL